jgi:hypothetical protein
VLTGNTSSDLIRGVEQLQKGDGVCLGSPVGVVGLTGLTGGNTAHLHGVFYQMINEISARRKEEQTGLYWLERGQVIESVSSGTPPTKFAAPFVFDRTMRGTGCEQAYVLAGRVITGSGQAVPKVTMNLSGALSMKTTPFVEGVTGGNYAFHGLLNGTYTVTPEATGYTFNPPSLVVTIAGDHVSDISFLVIPQQK